MDGASAIATLRAAQGSGADAVLSATSLIMQFGSRTCTYAELSAAWAAASGREDASPAWVAARAAGDEALHMLAASRNSTGEEYPAEMCRYGQAAAGGMTGEVSHRLVAFMPFRQQTGGSGERLTRWRPVALGPDTTLEYWLHAVDHGYQGSFPWGVILRWCLDTAAPRIHERRATVTTAAGQATVTRRPRLASGVTTGRWTETVQAAESDGVLAAAKTHPLSARMLRIHRPASPPEQGRLFPLPLPSPEERLMTTVSLSRHNPALRGDTTLLLDVAHMADRPVRGTVREWAGLLARTRTGGFRCPQASDYRRVWDAALAARSMHLRERDTQGRLTGRWAPLVHVDTAWSAFAPADPSVDEITIGPARWMRHAMRSTGGWTLTAAGGARATGRIMTGEASVAGLMITALEYYLAAVYDGRAGVARFLVPDHAGGPGPVVKLPWADVMFLAGEGAEFRTDKERRATYMRFHRALDRLEGRGYFAPPGAGAPAGDSVEIVGCAGRPPCLYFRSPAWFCAVAESVGARTGGFVQVPLGDYLRRREWRVRGVGG